MWVYKTRTLKCVFPTPRVLPCTLTAFFEEDSRMGGRVTQSGRAEISRVSRLKKALDSGAQPAFVHPESVSAPTHGSCSEPSCPLPPLAKPAINHAADSVTRLQFLEQMFAALPDGLSIADSAHRVLWAKQAFVRMFNYEAAEVLGQPLENLVVPPDRLAESRWVTEALARGERITLETRRRKKDGSLLDVSVS